MPVFNAEATLPECVSSILCQSLQDFEIIAVDDFSGDDSVALLHSYNDPRIKVISNKNKGIVSALNTGLSSCQSDFVARMDADDVMHAQRLEKQFQALNTNSSITLCATKARKFPEEIIKAGYVEYMRWQNACLTNDDIKSQIYIESPFVHPSVMFRKTRVLQLGAYREGDFPEDYELWLRLFQAGETMMKLDEVLLDWRESETRLSRNSNRYSEYAFEKIRAEYLAKDVRLQNRNIVFWGAGRKTRQRLQYLIDLGIKPSAWIDVDNNKVGQKYHGARTYFPEWLTQRGRHAGDEKPLVLNCVRNHGARKLCQAFLESAGYVMGKDYLDIA